VSHDDGRRPTQSATSHQRLPASGAVRDRLVGDVVMFVSEGRVSFARYAAAFASPASRGLMTLRSARMATGPMRVMTPMTIQSMEELRSPCGGQ